jgi:hypothetical protein
LLTRRTDRQRSLCERAWKEQTDGESRRHISGEPKEALYDKHPGSAAIRSDDMLFVSFTMPHPWMP